LINFQLRSQSYLSCDLTQRLSITARKSGRLYSSRRGTLMACAGVTGTLATFFRRDGSSQISPNGDPLSCFPVDTCPGDINGNGVGGNRVAACPCGHWREELGNTSSASETGEADKLHRE
jgi:hypothetical protein